MFVMAAMAASLVVHSQLFQSEKFQLSLKEKVKFFFSFSLINFGV